MQTLSKQSLSPYVYLIIGFSFLIRLFFINQHNLLVEEAYYWNYAAHLDFSYLDHPPLIAILIKLSTWIFGINEFAVRLPALLCWLVTVYFSYRWTEMIQKGSGWYAALLLSILPFFFVYSEIMTPDLPLMAAWSASLYYLYQALCDNQRHAWYGAGIAIGLGLLAKYSIALLIIATGLYMLASPKNRVWFTRKEPYLAAGIFMLLFTPVIYWNATHAWMSFAFQSTRRITAPFCFSFHELFGLFLLFLTPVGVMSFIKLWQKPSQSRSNLNPATQQFIRVYTLIPLTVFAVFSFSHDIKSNWIGPGLLALMPWLAMLMAQNDKILRQWLITGPVLLLAYAGILFCISFGQPAYLNQTLLSKMISWDHLTQKIVYIASTLPTPVLIPLDTYSIASELAFYQAMQKQRDPQYKLIPVHSAGLFGFNSLMFELWSKNLLLQDKTLILIGKDANVFDTDLIRQQTTTVSPIIKIWGQSQGQALNVRPYYYQIVKLNPVLKNLSPQHNAI